MDPTGRKSLHLNEIVRNLSETESNVDVGFQLAFTHVSVWVGL